MDHSPAKVLAELLKASSSAPFTNPADSLSWPLFIASMPDGENVENDCGALFDTVGVREARLLSGTNVFQHGVQVRIRATVYQDGWAKGEEVEAILSAIHNEPVVVGAATYLVDDVSQATPMFALGQEPGTRRREIFTVNFLVRLSQTT